MESEFEIGGHQYRTGRLSARQQFHVVRRFGTVAGALGSILEHLKSPKQTSLAKLEPLLKAIGDMPDEDVDYIITNCLAVVQTYRGNAWHRVQALSGEMMYSDIELQHMLQIVFEVMKANLSSFFSALPSAPMPEPEGNNAGTGLHSRMGKTG